MLMNRRDLTADFVGRHCYCPDLFLSASDIVRTGAQNNPRDKLSASDMRYKMSYDCSPLNASPFRLSCQNLQGVFFNWCPLKITRFFR